MSGFAGVDKVCTLERFLTRQEVRASSQKRLSSFLQAVTPPRHSGVPDTHVLVNECFTAVLGLQTRCSPWLWTHKPTWVRVRDHSKVQHQGELFRGLEQWFECRWATHNPLLPCPEDILEPGFNVGRGEYKEKRIGFIMPSQILPFFLSHSPPLMSPFMFLFFFLPSCPSSGAEC